MSALGSARILLAVATATIALPALACSFVPGHKVFLPGPILRPGSTLVPAPKVTVDRIERGHTGGDPAATCADAGILVLAVPNSALGYSFEIVEGAFDDVVFPAGFVQPVATDPGLLRFVWLDGNTYVQEPINVVVRVITMSANGSLSQPLLLRIEDPGRGGVR
jgi:hypothetical protein